MRHTEPTRDQQLQLISNTAVFPPEASGKLRVLFPCFQYKPGCVCTSKLPITSGIASAKSCSAHLQAIPMSIPREDIHIFHNISCTTKFARKMELQQQKFQTLRRNPQDVLQELSSIFPKFK